MKKIAIILIVVFSINTMFAQKYFTKNGHISFFSTTPVEDIEAHNYQASSVLNYENGEIAFSLLMKGFEFEKALMQEHFNEKYVESDEFPKAKFKGTIKDYKAFDLTKNETFTVLITGEMTIHGVTKTVEAEGTITVKDGELSAEAKFPLAIEEYDINIPSVVKDKIAKEVSISVAMEYKKYVKK
ncbi:MAG: polyisoprenoid-binding protein YceI [Planctomycetota bacterium]|jgi:polyisoprenoid-binding protein YceI